MSSSVWLLALAVLAAFWIAASDQGFSTKKPGSWPEDDDNDDDNDDVTDDEDDGDDKPELLIASVLMKPYLQRREPASDEEFEGVIPDLLRAICETGHMTCDYDIELAADGLFGSRDSQGHWTGLIGEVKREEVDFAAAPLLISAERLTVVNFSIPFADIALTLLVNADDDVNSIDDVLSKNITLGGVHGGHSLEKLRNQPKAPYSAMWAAIESKDDSKVADLEEGVRRVLAGGYAFVCETDMARYYMGRYCRLRKIEQSFLPDKGHGFAFPKDNDDLEPEINAAIRKLKDEGRIQAIYDRWFSSTCGAAGLRVLRGLLLSAVALTLLSL